MGGMTALLCAALAGASVMLALVDPRTALERRLSASPPRGAPAHRQVVEPGRPAGVTLRLRIGAAAGVGLAVLMVLPGVTGLVVAAAAGALTFARTARLEPRAVRRRRALLEADLPHVVDLLLASVAAGAAPAEALARVSEVCDPVTREEVGVWVSRLRLGADPVGVWDDLAAHPQLGRLGVTLRRSAESGAPVVEALLRLSQDLRARHRAEVEARVRQVEVKAAVPLGVCLLPAFVLVGVVPLVAGSAMGFLAP